MAGNKEPWYTFSVRLPASIFRMLMRSLEEAKTATGSDSYVPAFEAILAEWQASNAQREAQIRGARHLQVYLRAGWHCESCGLPRPLQVHHRRHRSQGGTDDLDNLVALCAECHEKEHGG